MTLSRRQMLLASGAALLGATAPRRLFAAGQATKRVLFFTKSSGFQHSCITRKGDQLSVAEKILTDAGKEHGFEVVASKDGRLFDPDKIGQWDAFAFETTGDLTTPGEKGVNKDNGPPMSADGKKAFLDAILGGKGFIGMHCATDTFHSKGSEIDPYIQMIGGEFITHGAQHKCNLLVHDQQFPGAKPYGSSMEILDEWYALKNLPDDLHVIMSYDTSTMQGPMYKRPNFPETWTRMHGKGRVFYTSMGHREDVWESPIYQGLLMGALGWVTGKTEADVTPNVSKVDPGYQKLPA